VEQVELSEAAETAIETAIETETAVPQPPVYVVPSYLPHNMEQIYSAQFQAPVYYVDQYGRPVQPVYPPQQ
jgi:hypothetical protein